MRIHPQQPQHTLRISAVTIRAVYTAAAIFRNAKLRRRTVYTTAVISENAKLRRCTVYTAAVISGNANLYNRTVYTVAVISGNANLRSRTVYTVPVISGNVQLPTRPWPTAQAVATVALPTTQPHVQPAHRHAAARTVDGRHPTAATMPPSTTCLPRPTMSNHLLLVHHYPTMPHHVLPHTHIAVTQLLYCRPSVAVRVAYKCLVLCSPISFLLIGYGWSPTKITANIDPVIPNILYAAGVRQLTSYWLGLGLI